MYYVVVPAYNAESTIHRCVKSIPENTNMLSIVIIYDSSADNTILEVNRLEAERADITVISGNYGSAGAARNAGLEYIYSRKLTRADRILFLDSDDLFTENVVQVLKYTETNELIIYANNQSDFVNEDCISLDEMECVKEALGMVRTTHFDIPYRMNTVWGKIFPAQILANKMLFFYDDVAVAEDLLFMLQVYHLVDRTYVSCLNVYVYTENQDSITHKHLKNFKQTDERVQNYIIHILNRIDMSNRDRESLLIITRMKGILNIFGIQIFHKSQHKNRIYVYHELQSIQVNENYQFEIRDIIKYRLLFTHKQLLSLLLFKARLYNLLIFLR